MPDPLKAHKDSISEVGVESHSLGIQEDWVDTLVGLEDQTEDRAL